MLFMRIQKYISQCGVCSRRAAEEKILEGAVTVNGEIAQIGQDVDPEKDKVAVDGVTLKGIVAEKVVLAMNNRGLDADKFWFSLFHEIKHVLQQKIKTVFISASTKELTELDNTLERDADEFASNYLISNAQMKQFSPNKYTTDEEIVAFAKSIGIHPGIVAGRLQHEKIIPPNRCSHLKEKYVFSFFVLSNIIGDILSRMSFEEKTLSDILIFIFSFCYPLIRSIEYI